METNEDKAKQGEVCCDSSSQGNDVCCSSGSGGGKGWKTAVFIVVILLAGAVAAHALLTERSKTASVSGEAAASFDIAGSPAEVGAKSEQSSKAAAVSCGVTLDSIKSLDRMADEEKANVVFLFLTGENEELARSASAQIEATVNKLSAKGKQTAAFTLRKDSEGYDQIVKQFSVQTLPCVIVAGKGCGAVAVSDEITEAKLLGAFVKASVPISCVPRSGSPCCPE